MSGTVQGRLFTNNGPLNEAEIGFVQTLPVQFDGDGNPTQTAEVLTTTTTTDSAGSFALDSVEVGTDFDLTVRIGNSSDVVATGSVPAASGGDAVVKLGETNVSNDLTPFRIIEVSPSPGTDVSTATPSIAFTFNRPVAQNDFTREDASGNVDGTLIEEIILSPDIAKDTRSGEGLPINISFDSTRTKLVVTPTEPLEDGFIYNHGVYWFFEQPLHGRIRRPTEQRERGRIRLLCRS
jgi:hypothetical protein